MSSHIAYLDGNAAAGELSKSICHGHNRCAGKM
jgi:hypothetical protein